MKAINVNTFCHNSYLNAVRTICERKMGMRRSTVSMQLNRVKHQVMLAFI